MRSRVALGLTCFAVVAVSAAASACFYDSRWGEAKRAQQRLAARSGPADIRAADESSPTPDGGLRTWRVRVRPDAQFLAQNMEAQRRVADLLEDANRVLGPTVGLTLSLDRVEPWTTDTDDRPDAALEALEKDDPGRDVDLVVGLIGALPRQSDSLHEEGRATLLGKHVLMRGPARAGEHDAVDLTFGELSEDQRTQMLKLRQRHRALATLLHELGHCLGAIHETDPASLMAPRYSPKMGGYGGGAIALMRAALASSDVRATAAAQLALLTNASGTDWVPGERDAEITRLEAAVPHQLPTPAPAAASAAATTSSAPAELSTDDRARFARAQDLLRGGAVRAAFDAARPLFAAYPGVYAVQDLRCQLATVRWLPREQMLRECAGAVRLAPDAGADSGN